MRGLSIFLLFTIRTLVISLSIERRLLPGIWKLATEGTFPYATDDIRSNLERSLPSEDPYVDSIQGSSGQDISPSNGIEDDLLVKLNQDGSFRQCSEGYQEGCWISGRWELVDHAKLLLAMDRQYYGPPTDILLEGAIGMEDKEIEVAGQILEGKFTYPKTHPSFFEQPLFSANVTGSFGMKQAVATYSVMPAAKEETVELNFKPSDFYGRKFYMTVEPVVRRRHGRDDNEPQLPIDIRTMPIQFFQNNTFEAVGINKILRGRFGITELDELWFQVSLFGAGRSMPGSVYSEGRGLVHEDKRLYVGEIQGKAGHLFVAGSVTFGSDLGTDARPEPVGTFLLTETKDDVLYADDGEDELSDRTFE